jgi:hypothetical protein
LFKAETDPKIRQLRTNKLNKQREDRDAAIFAHGMAAFLGTRGCVVRVEEQNSEIDCILSWVTEGGQEDVASRHYCPVQLKELPSRKLNPKITLDFLLLDAKKYVPSEHTAFVVYISGRRRIDTVTVPKGFPFTQLWFFGCCSPDRERWFLYGDALGDAPGFTYFAYPH